MTMQDALRQAEQYEKEQKKQIITRLAKKYKGKITEQNCLEIWQAIKNGYGGKPDWQALHKAIQNEPCLEMTSYFDCPCEGNPLSKCPQSRCCYTTIAEKSENGTINKIRHAGTVCPKYKDAAQNMQEEHKRQQAAENRGKTIQQMREAEEIRRKLI